MADDNDTNRVLAIAQLRKLGYQASTVADGVEAIEALRLGSYKLVLMDCHMPVMDGFEATRRIRASINPAIPIIAVTADAMSGERERCLREGMDDYISKPVDLEDLRRLLEKWLPVSTPRAPAAASLPVRVGGDQELAGIVLKGFE